MKDQTHRITQSMSTQGQHHPNVHYEKRIRENMPQKGLEISDNHRLTLAYFKK